jgi:RHS repeat-associated protein
MITRAFDAAGSVIGVTDSVGNTLLSGVTYAYGLKPFRLAATDADRGAWRYTIDSLGERTSWTDANGQSFSETYDALSRPLTRTDPTTSYDPGLFTQWQYGSTPASHNVGKLISECSVTGNPTSCGSSPQYSETRTFDTLGRPSTRSITQSGNPGNDPGGVLLFTYGYSATTGLPSSLTYPTSTSGVALNIQYGYQNGYLQSVTDTTDTTATCGSTCTLWTANATNSFGEITQETLGNGVVTNRSYDAVTSWPSAATAGVGGGAALLNQSYAEDKNGNIMQRQDNNAGLTENLFYDADLRLTCATLTSSCSTPTFAYDGGVAGPGNITTQAGVGTYAYPAAGQPQPHAVTSITGTFNGIVNPSFSYDANGNMTSRAGSTINWSSYNYPTAISASDVTGNEEVQFSYGPYRQRWKQIYTSPTPTETTYYVGGLMDVVFVSSTTNYRHYVYAGSEPVAVYSRTAAGVNTMSYMLEDHQGGVSAIASNTGAMDVNESFSPFGTRRNPTTWSGAPSTTDLNTIAGLSRQGYTFQTWLGQSMGLNHMNGRVQDAILGRFLSPDPHIPDPSDAQSYNRYSYVTNNPLPYTDPTGFFSLGDLLNPFSNSNPLNPFGSFGRKLALAPFTTSYGSYRFLQRQSDSLLRDYRWLQPIAEIAACYWGTPYACASASAYLTRLNGGTMQQALIAGALTYVTTDLNIDTGNFATDAIAKGTIGGIDSSLTGGSFTRGFEFSATGSLALSTYRYVTGGYDPDFGPGRNQPATGSCGPGLSCYVLEDGHVPGYAVDSNVFGDNNLQGFCQQSTSLCSQIGNASPTGHAISLVHDNMDIQIGESLGPTWKTTLNFPLMIPSLVLTEAAFAGEYYLPLINTGRRY